MYTSATAAAVPVEIELSGETYLMHPLTEKDWGTFEVWMQERILSVASERSKLLPPEDRKIILEHAVTLASRIEISSPQATVFLTMFDGIARLIWLSLKHANPQMKLEDTKALLRDERTKNAAIEKFGRINAGPDDGKKKETGTPTTGNPSTDQQSTADSQISMAGTQPSSPTSPPPNS